MRSLSLMSGGSLSTTVLLAAMGIASSAPADTIVAPAGVETSGLNTIFRSAPRAYQEYFASSNFGSIGAPVYITGMQVRLSKGETWRPAGYMGASWPSQNLTISSWDIQMATPTAQLVTDGEYLSTAPTFDSYLGANVTTVRSGSLTINAGSYLADGANPAVDEHSYGPVISFSTPYLYNPGDALVMMIRHNGYTPNTEPNAFFAVRGFENGVCDAISSTAGQAAASPNGFSSPYLVQFTYSAVPGPGSLALVGLAGATLGRRRRRSN